MRNFDLTPLFRSTVGFDHFASLLDRALSGEIEQNTYPPFNIEKTAEDAYRISIAVAGFSDDDLNVEVRENHLIVQAKKSQAPGDQTYLHRGIAARAFEKRFQLADHVRANGASHENGMLHIDLVREVPEALKPRRIEIASAKTIDAKPARKAVEKAA